MEDKNAILILGNGFDKFHNFPTLYTEFIDDCKANFKLINYFRKKKDYHSWVDIENQLYLLVEQIYNLEKDYSYITHTTIINIKFKDVADYLGCQIQIVENAKNGINNNGFTISKSNTPLNFSKVKKDLLEEFVLLKELLTDYIKKVTRVKPEIQNQLSEFFEKYESIIVVNYNYTDTIEIYKGDTNIHNLYVHGNLDNIILGHSQIYYNEMGMMNKTSQILAHDNNFRKAFIEIYRDFTKKDNFDFVVIGHSLDENDFSNLEWCMSKFTSIFDIIDFKNYILFYYNENDKFSRITGFQKLIKQLNDDKICYLISKKEGY